VETKYKYRNMTTKTLLLLTSYCFIFLQICSVLRSVELPERGISFTSMKELGYTVDRICARQGERKQKEGERYRKK